jgi:hypothetical protein
MLYWRATLLGHPAATGRKKHQIEPYPYGENSGDSMHAEPHFGTSCHHQMFF